MFDFEYGQMNSFNMDNGRNRLTIFLHSRLFIPTCISWQKQISKAVKSILSVTKSEIINQVKRTWWQLSYFYSKLRLLQYQDSLYTGFLKAASMRADLGETNKLEKVSAESQSLEVKNLIKQVKGGY